jgi:hypothetical protein
MVKEFISKNKNKLVVAGLIGTMTVGGVLAQSGGGERTAVEVSATQGGEKDAHQAAAPAPQAEVISSIDTSNLPTTLPPLEVVTSTTTAANTPQQPSRPEARPAAAQEYSAEKKLQIANDLLKAIEDDTIANPSGVQRTNEKLIFTKVDGSKWELPKPIALKNSDKNDVDLKATNLDHTKVFYVGMAPKAGATADANGYIPHEAHVFDPSNYADVVAEPLSPGSQPMASEATFAKRGIAVVGFDRLTNLAHDVGQLRPFSPQVPNTSIPEQQGEILGGSLPPETPYQQG